MAWMLAPRSTFEGQAPLDACLDRENCIRGLVVHGLGLGLDVERPVVDELIDWDDDGDDGRDDRFHAAADERKFDDLAETFAGLQRRKRATPGPRLYTATIASTHDNFMVQAFHASVAYNRMQIKDRLVARFGPDLASAADVRLSVDRLPDIPAAALDRDERHAGDRAPGGQDHLIVTIVTPQRIDEGVGGCGDGRRMGSVAGIVCGHGDADVVDTRQSRHRVTLVLQSTIDAGTHRADPFVAECEKASGGWRPIAGRHTNGTETA